MNIPTKFPLPQGDTEVTADPNAVRDIDIAVRVLNEAFAADPGAMHALMHNVVPCNIQLADHPTIVVQGLPNLDTNAHSHSFTISPIGLLNGVLSAITDKRVMSVWDDSDKDNVVLQGFGVYGEPFSKSALPKVEEIVLTMLWCDNEGTTQEDSYTAAEIANGAVRGKSNARIMCWHREPEEVEEHEVRPIIRQSANVCVMYPKGTIRFYSTGVCNFVQKPAP